MEKDFLWHVVSEKEKEEIKAKAKQIMDDFAKKLEPVSGKIKEEPFVEREQGERQEGGGEECDKGFREVMFSNAPKKDKDFIIAEKREWK
jgi:hypothetical protein